MYRFKGHINSKSVDTVEIDRIASVLRNKVNTKNTEINRSRSTIDRWKTGGFIIEPWHFVDLCKQNDITIDDFDVKAVVDTKDGLFIKHLLAKYGYKQKYFCEVLSVSTGLLSSIKANHRNFSDDLINKIYKNRDKLLLDKEDLQMLYDVATQKYNYIIYPPKC